MVTNKTMCLEMFLPTMLYMTICFFLTLVIEMGWEMRAMDI